MQGAASTMAAALQEAVERGELARMRYNPASGPSLMDVLELAVDVASGVAYLHEHGIVHGGEQAQGGDSPTVFVYIVGFRLPRPGPCKALE